MKKENPGQTDASQPQLTGLFDAFGLDADSYRVAVHRQGLIHDSYRIELPAGGGLFAQRLNPAAFPDVAGLMANLAAITRQLDRTRANEREQVLQIVPTRHGQASWRDAEGVHWRVFRLIDHAVAYNQPTTGDMATEVAHAFADYVRRLAPLDPAPRTLIPGFHDTTARLRALEAVLETPCVQLDPASETLVSAFMAHRALAERLAGLPQRTVHNDTKCNNVLFHRASGERLCVVDLDTTQPGLLAHDYGDMLRSALNPYAEDTPPEVRLELPMERFRAMTAGYLAGLADLATPAEIDSLLDGLPVISFELGLRFLTDHLNGDRYFAVQYAGHNLLRARRQLRMLETTLEHWARLRDVFASERRRRATA